MILDWVSGDALSRSSYVVNRNEEVFSDKNREYMMTPSNGNTFRVTGPLYGEFTGTQLIPLKKTSDAVLRCFLRSASE